ncbi:hypothetical protein B0H12DRAFT_1047526 [Mycena haematopus]|nr:hypothetical protein B0H12DRAFT_1047526 [Mycena haematopus]
MSRALPPHWPQTAEIAQKISHANKPSPRLGRKGFLYLQKTAPRAVPPPERVKIVARRIMKAERDERMDITHALTPVKQYMAGFTRPTDLRSSNWFPGGAYVSRKKVYESPVEEAYQSHTVYILESRYNIRYGVGRVEAPDYVYGVCREEDFPAVLKAYNSPNVPRSVLEAMDNARWPQGPQRKPHSRQRWWVDKADLQNTLQEVGSTAPPPDPDDPGDEEDIASKPKPKKNMLRPAPMLKPNVIVQPSNNSSVQSSVRAFHSSSILLAATDGSEPSHQHPPAMSSSSAGAKRGFHTTTLVRAAEVEWDFQRARAQDPTGEWTPRSEYMPTLDTTPFWRPLISLTVSTRPIAFTLLRLSRGLSTGRPFHADIDNHDKKCRVSFIHRMRSLRVQRMHNLTVDMAEALAGLRGGVVGIRFEADSLGRGIGGEGLADPIPWEKRVIRIGIGKWYCIASELKELFRAKAEEIPATNPFEIYSLDDFGNRISDETGEVVPWTRRSETRVDRLKREPWYAEYLTLCQAEKILLRQLSAGTGKMAEQPKKNPTRTVVAEPERDTNTEIRQAAAVDDAEEESDDELRLSDDEDMDNTDAAETSWSDTTRSPWIPTVLMAPKALQALNSRDPLDDSYLTLSTEDPDFVLCKGNAPILGPRDKETGLISTEGMVTLRPALARVALKRRRDMLCVTRAEQIGMILAAASTKVDLPTRLNN